MNWRERCRNTASLAIPLLQLEPWLQRAGIEVSVEELLKYIDPNAAMTIVTSLLAQLSNAMTSIFLLFLTVVFMLLEVPQLPAKLQQMMVRPVEGMGRFNARWTASPAIWC
jgi:AI-2 transport protein TqsA